MSCGYSSQSQEEKKLIKVLDKHIVGGAKRGRKKVGSEVFNKYKDNTDIKKLDEKICQQMTLKQLRQTALYKNLHYDPQNRPAWSGKKGSRFGKKSYLSKSELCKYLNDSKKYITDLNKAYASQTRAGPRIRKTRAGDCIPKARVPINNNCNSNGEFKHTGKTSSGISCCYKKTQKTKSSRRQNKTKTSSIVLKKNINKIVKNLSKTTEILNYLESSVGISTQIDFNRFATSPKKFLTKLDKYDANTPNALNSITYSYLRKTITNLM